MWDGWLTGIIKWCATEFCGIILCYTWPLMSKFPSLIDYPLFSSLQSHCIHHSLSRISHSLLTLSCSLPTFPTFSSFFHPFDQTYNAFYILWSSLLEWSIAMVLIHCHISFKLGFFIVLVGVRIWSPAKRCSEYSCIKWILDSFIGASKR
jgi:hypothetical protein